MSATRPPCRDCGKTRPLMTDRRCGSCHETHRLAGRPKDMFASINDVLDEPSRLERVAMTVITQPPPASPPTLVPASDWTGRYQACRICGNRDRREVEDGLCTACFTDEYGPSARKAAEARRDARRPAAPLVTAPTPAPPPPAPPSPVVPAPGATAKPWHPEFPDGCVNCGTTTLTYQSRGLCSGCRPQSYKPGYTGKIAPKKVRVGGQWVYEDAPEALLLADTKAAIDASITAEPEGEDLAPPESGPVSADEPTAAPPVSPVAAAEAPVERADTVIPEAAPPTVRRPDLVAVPLADLLAEVERRASQLAVRLHAAERDADRWRRIAPVLREIGAD